MITARPPTRRPIIITKRPPTPRPIIITKRPPTTTSRKPIPANQFVLPEVKVNVNRPIVYAQSTTSTTASTTILNTRTTPPPNIFVDGFIIGNINRNPGDKDLPRNENTEPQSVRKPDFSNLNWMDSDKKEALALIESDMVEQHNIDGVRPMFEFTFEDDATVHQHDHDHEDHDHHEEGQDAHHDHENHAHDHHGQEDHDHHDHGEHHMEGDHEIHEMHHDHHEHHDHMDHDDHHHDHHGDQNHEHEHGHEHHEHHDHMDHEHGHHEHGHDHHSSNSLNLPSLPNDHQGLEETSNKLKRAEKSFIHINNDLGFNMFKKSIQDPDHQQENLIFNPLSATTSLALVFLGARGVTSWQINELLRLDEMISFNPHLMYKSITDDLASSEDFFTTACVKELLIDEDESPLIEFYRARVDYFYSGTIEQIDFDQLNTNAGRLIDDMVSRKTQKKILNFMAQDQIPPYAPPMISLGANAFQADFPKEYDLKYQTMNFINLPRIGRRLVKVPSVKLMGKFFIGYEETLQATTAAIPFQKDKFSLVLILPGRPSDYIAGGLSQIESKLNNETWTALMRSMQPVDHVEIQFPVINHRYKVFVFSYVFFSMLPFFRSFVNLNETLQSFGMLDAFNANKADFTGINGANDLYLTAFAQINDIQLGRTNYRQARQEEHHDHHEHHDSDQHSDDHAHHHITLKFERQFLYAIRHNPTGMVTHLGRYYEPTQ